MSASNSYVSGSVFTVKLAPLDRNRNHEVGSWTHETRLNDPSFDLAVVQFNDDGSYVDRSQIDAATQCIDSVRNCKQNPNGALVVLFIHGWHHSADWGRTPSVTADNADGDTHFHSFRLVLESLALREAERHADGRKAGRRVIGIYFSWNGDPQDSNWKATLLSDLSFYDRYKVAKRIGASAQMVEAFGRIVTSTKRPFVPEPDSPRPDSPLVAIGHSMGALVLQSAVVAMLENSRPQFLLPRELPRAPGPVEVTSDSTAVSGPDLMLSINSAADSAITRRILDLLKQRGVGKVAREGSINYCPPLLISVGSTEDTATKIWWSAAHLGRQTDGNDSALFTHDFERVQSNVTCQPRGTLDFGQSWHCLRPPQPPGAPTPAIVIDLPCRERRDSQDFAVTHDRYCIRARESDLPRLAWVFQVPFEVIPDHNTIFNHVSRSLILGLIQASGAVASLANTWTDSFEPGQTDR